MKSLSIFFAIFHICHSFTLPKIFKSGMVLQAEPTDAVIWGFLGENKNPVNVNGQCNFKGQKITLAQMYSPSQVLTYFEYHLAKK